MITLRYSPLFCGAIAPQNALGKKGFEKKMFRKLINSIRCYVVVVVVVIVIVHQFISSKVPAPFRYINVEFDIKSSQAQLSPLKKLLIIHTLTSHSTVCSGGVSRDVTFCASLLWPTRF